MKPRLMITAALLALALPTAAEFRTVQEAYEVALSDLRLPRAEGGTIVFKECANCEYVRYQVGADTQYRINGKAVPLVTFRAAMSKVADPDSEAVTVLRHVDTNQVTAVSVYL